MATGVILATILGLTFVFSPLVVGALYLRDRQSDQHRLERRFRDLE
jgi:uncharacterized membrane protein YciS (DUF1049 family)